VLEMREVIYRFYWVSVYFPV